MTEFNLHKLRKDKQQNKKNAHANIAYVSQAVLYMCWLVVQEFVWWFVGACHP